MIKEKLLTKKFKKYKKKITKKKNFFFNYRNDSLIFS